jgi:hypothetical protein
MAWRPAYHPQLPHTTWGSLVALQRGQMLRGAGVSVQLEARRLRLFDLEVFFFGTAMVVSTLEGGLDPSGWAQVSRAHSGSLRLDRESNATTQ